MAHLGWPTPGGVTAQVAHLGEAHPGAKMAQWGWTGHDLRQDVRVRVQQLLLALRPGEGQAGEEGRERDDDRGGAVDQRR